MLATMQRMLHKRTRSRRVPAKEALLDTRRPISAASVQQRKTFLSDLSASPLSGGDPIIARRAATQLQRSVAHTQNPDPGHPVSPNTNVEARR
jgi:hypothetical protein